MTKEREANISKNQKAAADVQGRKFKDAARELDCADDDTAFDRALKKVASAPPPKSVKKRKEKRPAK